MAHPASSPQLVAARDGATGAIGEARPARAAIGPARPTDAASDALTAGPRRRHRAWWSPASPPLGGGGRGPSGAQSSKVEMVPWVQPGSSGVTVVGAF